MITLDAQGKKIGRIASEAAYELMGKNDVKYQPHVRPTAKVTIINCAKAYVTAKKKLDKVYVTFTGFRGGLKSETLSALEARKGVTESFRRAVYRMIPNTTHRKEIMKNLTLVE